MKILLVLFLYFVFVINSFASPLIFKAVKVVNSGEPVELAMIDTAKYKQIRIAIKIANQDSRPMGNNTPASNQLIQKRAELESKLENFRKQYGDRSQEVIDIKQQLAYVDEALSTIKSSSDLAIYGIEGGEDILLQNVSFDSSSRSITVDSPPSTLRVMISGSGTYKIFIWGTQ